MFFSLQISFFLFQDLIPEEGHLAELPFANSYFSLEDIIASNDKLCCKFRVSIPELGHLIAGSDMTDIPPGARLELPCWLASSLCNARKQTAEVDLPKQYRAKYREIFNAEATVVDLHKLGPMFYLSGLHLKVFPYPEVSAILETLSKMIRERAIMILDAAANAASEARSRRRGDIPTTAVTVTTCLPLLDELEKLLYRSGESAHLALHDWYSRKGLNRVEASSLARHRKKRSLER